MKKWVCLVTLLGISAVALANPNNPANRCKRYAQANAFQNTVAQLCGGDGQSEFAQVMETQACDSASNAKQLDDYAQQQTAELRAEYERSGGDTFCAKYGHRR